jgi:hypothetical protein
VAARAGCRCRGENPLIDRQVRADRLQVLLEAGDVSEMPDFRESVLRHGVEL